MRIWLKTLRDQRITRDIVHEMVGKSTKKLFEDCLRAAAERMDIPCPVLVNSNFDNFFRFNITKFAASDFVESIDFDVLTVENITE